MMSNPARLPLPLPSSTDRRTRHTRSPVEHLNNTNTNTLPRNPAISTRRSSRGASLLGLDDEKATKNSGHATSRKRPATAIEDATTADPRPPTRVKVTQPHGELLRITNGVSALIGIAEDDLPSGASTPKPTLNGAAAGLTVLGRAAATQTKDKRSLRSHDGGSRLKSDLATYFSNYDDIIAGAPKSPGRTKIFYNCVGGYLTHAEFVELETPIYIIDEPLKSTKNTVSPEPSRTSPSPSRSRQPQAHTPPRKAPVNSVPRPPSSPTYQVLDYSSIAKLPHDGEKDPLADSVYFMQHRRAERKEKQLRNIEKERAMHEKVQLERLLDGLQGPDWLKVMGITGVTDGERKDWEPKRDYFIREVETLVDKFRLWKEEEKRLRAEKEAALAARDDEEDEEEGTPSDVGHVSGAAESSASEQRDTIKLRPQQPRRPPRPHGFFLAALPPEPQAPFTSFYAKPHLRAAALGKQRHGRNAVAFGQLVPEFEEHEFKPPSEYLTVEALRDHARKRRRQKRESSGKN
jgi:hypothetical protein